MYTHSQTLNVNDISLASALLTLGCSLDSDTPFFKYQTEHGTTLTFMFAPSDDTQELMDIWHNPELDKEHPIALMKIFNTNRIGIVKEIKEAAGLVEIKKNGKTLLMSSNCSEEQKAKLIARL